MLKILQKSFRTGIVTAPYPPGPDAVSDAFRGRPEFEFAAWLDARPAAEVCPTGAIEIQDHDRTRRVTVNYGKCVFCGGCADVSGGAVRTTQDFALAATDRRSLVLTADYSLNYDGTHRDLLAEHDGRALEAEAVGGLVESLIRKVLGRSLAIREVDAGSCNGCELEIIALNNPVHDIERFGIHFVASPRHADMLLVTGPVTRNLELALRKTYAATPDPKVVAAVGACGISTGIFGRNYAVAGAVDDVVPVDVYIPGCPPRPEALLRGILLAVEKLREKRPHG